MLRRKRSGNETNIKFWSYIKIYKRGFVLGFMGLENEIKHHWLIIGAIILVVLIFVGVYFGFGNTGNIIYTTNSISDNITTFNNSMATENLTFSGNENITRYLEINGSANITNATINLRGRFELLPTGLSGESWKQFSKHLNNSGFTSNTLPENISHEYASFDIGDNIWSSPVVADGYVYIGANNKKVYQLNASNVSNKISEFTSSYEIDTGPAVQGDYVYAAGGKAIHQLNSSNISQEIERNSPSSTGSQAIHETVRTDGVYYDGSVYYGEQANKVVQLDSENVSVIQQSFVVSSTENPGDVQATPAIHEDYFYVGALDSNFYQRDAQDISVSNSKVGQFNADGDVGSGAAVSDEYVYFGDFSGIVYQLEHKNVSNEVARFDAGDKIQDTPSIGNGYVYIGDFGNDFYQLNASNISDVIATYGADHRVETTPIVTKDYVIMSDREANIYVLNASNISQEINRHEDVVDPVSSPAVANGYFYTGGLDGKVHQLGGNASYPRDPFLDTGSHGEDKDWNHSGEFRESVEVDFTSYLNDALNNTQSLDGSCPGGNLSEGNCTIPFLFHSDSESILEYSNLSVEYGVVEGQPKGNSPSPNPSGGPSPSPSPSSDKDHYPLVNASCNSSVFVQGESLDCGCEILSVGEGSANVTKNTTSPDNLGNVSVPGNFTYNCLVEDIESHEHSDSINYTVIEKKIEKKKPELEIQNLFTNVWVLFVIIGINIILMLYFIAKMIWGRK